LPLTSERVRGRYFSTKSIEIERRNQEIKRYKDIRTPYVY